MLDAPLQTAQAEQGEPTEREPWREPLPRALEEAYETRVLVSRWGHVRLTPAGALQGDGTSQDEGRMLVAVQERGDQVQVRSPEASADVLVWVSSADLERRLVRDVVLTQTPGGEAREDVRVELAEGVGVEVASEREDALLVRYANEDVRVAGWIPRDAYGVVFRPTPFSGTVQRDVELRTVVDVYDAEDAGEVIAVIGPEAWGSLGTVEAFPRGAEGVAELPTEGRVAIRFTSTAVSIRGWVDGAALESTPNMAGGRNGPVSFRKAKKAAFFNPQVVTVRGGARLYAAPGGGPVVGVFGEDVLRVATQQQAQGFTEIEQPTSWGTIRVWVRDSELIPP